MKKKYSKFDLLTNTVHTYKFTLNLPFCRFLSPGLKYERINSPVNTIYQEKRGRKKCPTELIKGKNRLRSMRVKTRSFENISKTTGVDFVN